MYNYYNQSYFLSYLFVYLLFNIYLIYLFITFLITLSMSVCLSVYLSKIIYLSIYSYIICFTGRVFFTMIYLVQLSKNAYNLYKSYYAVSNINNSKCMCFNLHLSHLVPLPVQFQKTVTRQYGIIMYEPLNLSIGTGDMEERCWQ